MRIARSLLADPDLRDALATGLDAPPAASTAALARTLRETFGSGTLAVIAYGSHAQRSDARPESAHDFFVIVARYLPAYRSLVATRGTSYRAATAALLNHILPPNVISVRVTDRASSLLAKCAVFSLAHLARACSAHARDQWAQGRLFQNVQLVWTRDPESRAAVTDAIIEARARTFEWGRAALPAAFDAESYCRTLLETSYAAEIRPEGGERIEVLLNAQRDSMLRIYAALLRQLAQQRILAFDGKVYRQTRPPGAWTRFRIALHFRRSKWRATLRWLKYIWLYEGWLDYIVQKLARRSGVSVELTPRERRWPLIFLWPKAIHFLRTRPQRRR